ncbi:hypothetical protein JCM15519_27160 [Fundidesulfovibrio butyratiphilus]
MFFNKKRDSKTWDAISRASLMGTNMVASTLVGLAIGYYLDKWLGTSPWMLIAWLLFGIVAGFRSMYLEAMRINRAHDESGTGERAQGDGQAGTPRSGDPKA